MKPDPSKLRHQTHERQSTDLQQSELHKAAVQFETAEQMIREDAKHTPVPVEVAERLNDSIAQEPKPAAPWWRRLFSKSR